MVHVVFVVEIDGVWFAVVEKVFQLEIFCRVGYYLFLFLFVFLGFVDLGLSVFDAL